MCIINSILHYDDWTNTATSMATRTKFRVLIITKLVTTKYLRRVVISLHFKSMENVFSWKFLVATIKRAKRLLQIRISRTEPSFTSSCGESPHTHTLQVFHTTIGQRNKKPTRSLIPSNYSLVPLGNEFTFARLASNRMSMVMRASVDLEYLGPTSLPYWPYSGYSQGEQLINASSISLSEQNVSDFDSDVCFVDVGLVSDLMLLVNARPPT